jgi:multiple antibiotic resistance protein
MLDLFINTYVKLFFLLTPFFVISTFLSMTTGMTSRQRRRIALRTIGAVIVFSLILYLFGNRIFAVMGITLDAFRIGAGAMLFLSAVALVAGKTEQRVPGENEDISVVPLAMPVTVGPGTTGTLLVLGTDVHRDFGGDIRSQAVAVGALLAAVLSVGILLYVAARAQRLLPPRIMSVLTKLTGLVLASLAAELIFTGIRNFLRT